ncbi:MAG: helix-turn-helix domain-containing protein [bacterium]
MKYLEHALNKLNLSENAKKLYLQSFHSGRSTIGELAKTLEMDRSSTYLAIQQLVSTGLMTEDVIDGKKRVWANPPSVIESMLSKKAEDYSDAAQEIHENLGELLVDYKANHQPVSLQSFSGRDSLRRITQDILSSRVDEIRIFTNQNAERKVFSANEHDDFILSRIKNGIKAYVLAADTKGADLLKKYDERELRETKIRKDLKPLKNETYIYGDKVAVLGFSDTIFGFIVHDKEFAQLQKLLFDNLFMSK